MIATAANSAKKAMPPQIDELNQEYTVARNAMTERPINPTAMVRGRCRRSLRKDS